MGGNLSQIFSSQGGQTHARRRQRCVPSTMRLMTYTAWASPDRPKDLRGSTFPSHRMQIWGGSVMERAPHAGIEDR